MSGEEWLTQDDAVARLFAEADEAEAAKQRKRTPVWSGVCAYFPLALKEIARVSWQGSRQHHPDKPLHWDKGKSNDHADCAMRHRLDHDANPIDTDGHLHLAKYVWRALAELETYLEAREAEDAKQEA